MLEISTNQYSPKCQNYTFFGQNHSRWGQQKFRTKIIQNFQEAFTQKRTDFSHMFFTKYTLSAMKGQLFWSFLILSSRSVIFKKYLSVSFFSKMKEGYTYSGL